MYHGFVVMGPPGAGKGTLCAQLARMDATYHFDSGENFRSLAREDSALAQEFRQVIDSGAYFPDDLAVRLLADRLSADGVADELVLLDGIPRTAAQVDLLEDLVSVRGVVSLHAPDEVLLERLLSRASRPADRDVAKARGRIQEFYEKTLPALERLVYRDARILSVPSDRYDPAAVFDEVVYRFAGVF